MVNATAIFLPLYLYPFNSSWDSVTKSIAQYPDLNFQIVVAPNLINVIPDTNYITHLQILNNYTNVQTLGYVSTAWATRNITIVREEISCYAAWANYTAADIKVSGIFFDEAPSANSTDNMSYMANVTSLARELLGPGKDKITYNPGVVVDASWYNMAEEIIVFENTWSAFNLSKLEKVPPEIRSKSIYLIHSFTGDLGTQNELIGNLTDQSIAGAFVTTREGYTEISTLWDPFCEALNSVVVTGLGSMSDAGTTVSPGPPH
ncbi:Spherulation-specific family 4 [Amylocarpus encephaloides]|uniref:Spherulation-specific family 4 n=1 Tax=Amylocarpus encephaloides TaxID=45428 RepID=A0A9P8C0U8_9HELO|nr:Spherulation-specific family 4 [Amylocarpus encephaloides]